MDQWLEEMLRSVQEIAQSPSTREEYQRIIILKPRDDEYFLSQFRLTRKLDILHGALPYAIYLAFYDKGGTEISASSQFGRDAPPPTDEEIALILRGESVISELYVEELDPIWEKVENRDARLALRFIAPIVLESRVEGYVLLLADADALSGILAVLGEQMTSLGFENHDVYLVDSEGVFLPSSAFTVGRRPFAGETAPLSTKNWHVIAETDGKELAIPVRQTMKTTLMVLVSVVILVALFGLGIIRQLMKPLLALRDVAIRLASGQKGVRYVTTQEDEVGLLGRAFNTMAEAVDDSLADLHRQVNERKRAEERARAANEAKSRFLATMSHELRTPLNAVIGYSEMLQDEAVDLGVSDMIPDLKRINQAGQHLLRMVSDILDVSKIEAGKMDLHVESFDLASLIDSLTESVQPLAEANGNRLQVQCSEDLGEASTDATKVRQILYNLLSNACKFAEKGVVTLTAVRKSNGGVDVIEFEVADTGIGMTDEQIQRVFKPFTQAQESTTRRFGGTGLGLTITREFAVILGGTISVESEPGEGTTFRVRIPAYVKAPNAVRDSSGL